MSIKLKILLPMIIMVIIMASALLISNILLFSQYVGTTFEERVNSASAVASDGLAQLKLRAATASLYISEDSAVIEALETGNRDALLDRTIKIYKDMGVGFCTIADANGIAVARPHKPESFGDDTTAMPSVQSAMSGKNMTTIEPGTSVLMSVCSGAPVFDSQNRLIGVVVSGFRLDTPDFVDSIKNLTNCEVTIFLGDERISTTVQKEDGTRAIGTKASSDVSQTVLAGKVYVGKAPILGQDALTSYSPITDQDGKVQGMLFVGRYLTEKTDTVVSFIINDLIIVLVMLVISVPLILFISKQIVAPIHSMVEAAHTLSKGDVDVGISVNTKDEMSKLAEAFTEIVDNTKKQSYIIEAITDGDLTISVERRSDKDLMNNALSTMLERNNNVFSQVAFSAKEVASGARQIADNSQSLALGSTQQTAAIEQLSESIAEIAEKTKENVNMTSNASELAKAIRHSAEKGSKQMDQMLDAVKEIQDASNSISKVIKVIDDIAFQTNILALNAAVEAARAGQHGKGFAVVADEVRSLSAKSASAAKDTGRLIAAAMEKAELGVRIADETAVSLGEIVVGINESGIIVSDIARSSEEQSIAIKQINSGIEQVSIVVQQNTATAQEAASASEEMSQQANILENLVARFKTKQP